MEPARHSVRPAVLLSFVGALAIAYRIQLSWLESTPWYRRFAPGTIAEWSLLVGTFALAAAVSLLAAVVTQRRVNRILAVLVGAVVAGLVTTWYDSVAGAALGGAIGCLVAWAIVRQAVLAGLTVVAAVVTGTASGAKVLAFTGNPGDGWHGPMAWSMSALACGAASLLLWHALRGRARRRWLRFASHGVLLFAVVAGQWLSLSVDTLRRVWWLGTDHELGAKRFCTLVCDDWLIVARTQITDEGLRRLAGAQTLSGLDVSDTQVTNAGLAHLRSLPNLNYLQLAGTRITAAGLAQLESPTTTMKIDARRTMIRDDELPVLRKKLPKARIVIHDDDTWWLTTY